MDLETKVDDKVDTVGVYNYDDAVELTGHGRYNYLVLFTCCIIHHAVALDMFGFSMVLAAATCDLQIGITETGILASAPFAGVFFAFPFGYYADTGGRRRALLLSTIVGFTFAALSSFSTNWQMMLAFKILGCSFSTASFALTMAYLGECVGSKQRSRYLIIMVSMDLACEVVSNGIAYFVLPLTFHWPIPWLFITYTPWRLYTLILALPLGIGALLLLCLYESPKFLANKGDTKEALNLLRRIYVINGGIEEKFPVKQIKQPEEINSKTDTIWSSLKKQTVPLFQPPLLWRTLQLFYLMILCSTTNNVFAMWFPTMVNLFFNSISDASSNSGFCESVVQNVTMNTHNIDNFECDDFMSSNTIYSGIILGLIISSLNLSVSTLASWRRLVLIGSYIVSGVSCVLVGLLSHPIANITFFILIQTSAIGVGSVASYFVDLYPTTYRGLVTSLGMMMTRLTSFAGVNVLGAVFVDHCNLIFYSWAILVLSGVAVALFLPSDKKK
ncbi:PREDICTED: synaptic vesicle glycoprotein 2B-like [Papilio xuthus]|uniref:Synaptic vesicle glycoprotein 2B n=1 Tax=Papilio xuthus TaxID=66420 RepID=A0A194Q1Q2_PAPXU|nr:PREDICTED: synaptic vesicle glycoprotein 2B-like [Papilio xuthus]KPI99507.1 Synaptic vesicle glycoprotein 2B [Papilio xuthus]